MLAQIVLIIQLVLAVSLVVVVLMQRSEGGAATLTGGSGGGMGGFMSARGAANFLTRLTAILAVAFLASTLLLAIIAGGGRDAESLLDDVDAVAPPAVEEPVEPEAPSVPISE